MTITVCACVEYPNMVFELVMDGLEKGPPEPPKNGKYNAIGPATKWMNVRKTSIKWQCAVGCRAFTTLSVFPIHSLSTNPQTPSGTIRIM